MRKIKKILKDNLDIGVETGANVAMDVFLDGVLGQVASGVVSAKFSYKQKQLEKNVQLTLQELTGRMDNLEQAISDDGYELAKDTLFPMMFDYVLEETEVEKIKLFVNGFENSVSDEHIDLELTRVYYDVLRSLRVSELKYFIDRYVPKTERQELKLKIPPHAFALTQEEKELKSRANGYRDYQEAKLEQLGLVSTMFMGDGKPYREDTPITEFGHNFYKFFHRQ
ncbi:hypothetical protein [Priestia megaterium]|uniref:hypothetical protein n=1 Tax=Priestia megaterium TaxID=1404 RepID=UPI003A7F78F0